MKSSELRKGNLIYKFGVISTVEWLDLSLDEMPPGAEPIPLTEENILKLRVIERRDFHPLLFSVQPPRERQSQNHYWSGWVNEDYKLQLSPNYKIEWRDERTPYRSAEIDFWFIWYCDATRLLPLMNIRQHKLRYLHQLQNLYFALTNKELTVQECDANEADGSGNAGNQTTTK